MHFHAHYRLPHSNRTYFQCDVAICRGECVQPDCSSNVLTAGGGLAGLNRGSEDLKDGEDPVDPFERPEDDAVTTSTSVFVAQPGSEEAGTVYKFVCDSSFHVFLLNFDWIQCVPQSFRIPVIKHFTSKALK